MIELTGLTKRYRARTAVEDLTARVEPGRVTGFLGPNGSGKTTTMRCVLGLTRPTAGAATVLGVPCTELARTTTSLEAAYYALTGDDVEYRAGGR
ncbi:ATP-binding cassette domain-containing protein [Modestobacter roseus]|uniref:ATP-binding cassette domain-containing protein n=1 Tax=Modestobacter roseus TaxID=1181884 RepID=UPI0034DF6139